MNSKKLGGLGFRAPHYNHLLEKPDSINWIEVISENYMGSNGFRMQRLEKLREQYDVALHGVSLNIASRDEVNLNYLKKLKEFIQYINPVRVSDHLCWTGSHAHNFHDLLAFPYTEEMLSFIVDKVNKIQDILGRELILENLSAYIAFNESEMSEYEFITTLSRKTGCFNLLDINNLYVNATNYGFDPYKELDKIPIDIIKQVHLAGFTQGPGFLIDTHSEKVHEDVWKLFEAFYKKQQHIPFMVEWDDKVPDFAVIEEEVLRGSQIISEVVNG